MAIVPPDIPPKITKITVDTRWQARSRKLPLPPIEPVDEKMAKKLIGYLLAISLLSWGLWLGLKMFVPNLF